MSPRSDRHEFRGGKNVSALKLAPNVMSVTWAPLMTEIETGFNAETQPSGLLGLPLRSALTVPDELPALLFSHRSGSPAVSWIITFDGILKVVKLSFPGIFFFKSRERKEAFSFSHSSF